MAAMSSVKVPCPECGDTVEVDIDVSTEYVEGDGLRVTLTPNASKVAEHYAVEHCGAEVTDEG